MLKRKTHPRSIFVLLGILCSVCLFVKCIDNENKKLEKAADTAAVNLADSQRFKEFAGSAVCADCHRDIYKAHIRTAHFLTSRQSAEGNIMGSTAMPNNRFYYNPDLYVAVEKKGDQFFQTEYTAGVETYSAPIDITVGSGKRGETFLYRYKNKLLQLPLTYFTELHRWTNSPGFSNRVIFRRPATSRCLECHSTYFQVTSAPGVEPEDFSKTNIVYGVDCERCHGPAARHVAFQRDNPKDRSGQFIINPKNFSREQSLELCRLCHGGRLAKIRPSFSFQPGDKLADYFALDTAAKSLADLDVHGNQFGRLAASKCFRMSGMTCLTCHSPHDSETGKKELFSQRCMSCHNLQHGNFCKLSDRIGAAISKNCIDCHMPEERSRSIIVLLQGESVPTSAVMRSHYISIYPDQTSKFLNKK